MRREATLAGRGLSESGESGSLLFVSDPIIAVWDRQIFVDGAGRSGACNADSGGPLLVLDDAVGPSLAGVLNSGSTDCRGVNVYTRADVIRPWVEENVAPTGCQR